MEKLFEGLNPPQLATVKTLSGPLLVIAGAGSGKTRVLTRRLANLVHNGVPASRILAVTFTNKAAQEMKKRVTELTGEQFWIGTFHSISAKLLRFYGDQIGVSKNFVIYDSNDQKNLIKRICKENSLEADAKTIRATVSLIESYRCKKVKKLYYPYDSIFEIYKKRLEDNKAVDFSGLIEKAGLLKDILPDLWDHVLVDEFQDTNKNQFDLIKLMVSKQKNICAVGDDDQSIYSWRGANPQYLLKFEKDFPKAKIIRLEQNYRSSGTIIKAAASLISNNQSRRVKTLWTDAQMGETIKFAALNRDRDEAHWVGKKILKLVSDDVNYNQIALLYRMNAQSRPFEEDFRRKGIPYRLVGGLKFYERAEIKDLLSYLRLTLNKSSENDILRVVNKPRRGIGNTSLEKLINVAREKDIPLWEVLQNPPAEIKGAKKGIIDFVFIIDELTSMVETEPAYLVLERLFELTSKMGFKDSVEDEDLNRMENMDQLYLSMKEIGESEENTLLTFLDEVSLLSADEKTDENDEGVTLMTIHSAKGLEFDYVFLPGWEEGVFPLRRKNEEVNIEEERRLAYVSITRAKYEVYISRVKERSMYGPAIAVSASQFLFELPKEHITIESNFTPMTNISQRRKQFRSNAQNKYSNPAKNVKSVKSTTISEDGLNPGVVVLHKKFGKGTIKAIVGEGKMRKAIVNFSRGDSKVILATFLTIA
jgi:ATP-dependent DNA helicase UvrD/PcrA